MATTALPTPEQIKRAISDESRTLTQVLTSLGMTHEPTGRGYRHRVVLGTTIVFDGSAHMVWGWLRGLA